MICPRCKTEMDDKMRFCGICGEDMLAYLQTQQAEPEVPVAPEAPEEAPAYDFSAQQNEAPVQPPYDNSWQYNPEGNSSYAPEGAPAYNTGFNQSFQAAPVAADEDKPDILLNILSFIVPIAGMILYFVEREKHPIKARAALKSTLAAYIASYAFAAISVLFALGMMAFAIIAEGMYFI